MLELIKKRNIELMESNPQKYSLINDLLEFDNCFMLMPADTAISILLDLNYSIEEAKKNLFEFNKER